MEYETGSVSWLFKTFAAQTLLANLSQISGEKDMIISPSLIPVLDLTINFSLLKEQGVLRVYGLKDGPALGTASKRVYLINNDVKSTKIVSDQINSYIYSKESCDLQFFLIFVPRISKVCDTILENDGIYGYIQVFECRLGFIPMDYDLFLLQKESFFSSFFLNSDQSALYDLTLAIQQLQKLVGNVRCIHAIGKCSKMLLKMLTKQEKDHKSRKLKRTTAADQTTSVGGNLIENMLIIDRDMDFISTLVSQLNYEGLLDETFGIETCKIVVPKDITDKERLKLNSKLTMQSSDPVFRDIRDMHLSTAFGELKRKGQHLKAKQKEREDMNLTAMREFVSNELKVIQTQQKSLSIHISLCEIVLEKKNDNDFVGQLNLERNLIEGVELREATNYIEQLIVRQQCPLIALRLLCLYSIMQNGFQTKDYRNLTNLFLQSFGHEHVVTLFHLRKLGLLTEALAANTGLSLVSNTSINSTLAAAISAFPKSSSQLRTLIKRFNLVPPEGQPANLANPTDPSFVFGGNYIPLICRLIEYLFINRPPNMEELLKLLNAPMHSKLSAAGTANESHNSDQKKIIFVFFVGGVTFAEVSALRFLSKSSGYKILIGSTGTVNGSQLMKHLFIGNQ